MGEHPNPSGGSRPDPGRSQSIQEVKRPRLPTKVGARSCRDRDPGRTRRRRFPALRGQAASGWRLGAAEKQRQLGQHAVLPLPWPHMKKAMTRAAITNTSRMQPQPRLGFLSSASLGERVRTLWASFTWRRSRSAVCLGLGSGLGLGFGFGSGLGEGGFEPMPSQLRFGFSSSGWISRMGQVG